MNEVWFLNDVWSALETMMLHAMEFFMIALTSLSLVILTVWGVLSLKCSWRGWRFKNKDNTPTNQSVASNIKHYGSVVQHPRSGDLYVLTRHPKDGMRYMVLFNDDVYVVMKDEVVEVLLEGWIYIGRY